MADPEVVIDAEPDWKSGLDLSYGFQTVISGTPRLVEQRRPLYPLVTRSLSCTFLLEGEYGQALVNKLIYGKAKLCCVPIYSEPIFASAITGGESTITTVTDMTYLWNIQNCDYAVVINYVTGESQMLTVISASGNTILLSASISSTFDASESIIYPAFSGYIKGFRGTAVTDLVSAIDCEFEENTLQEENVPGVGVSRTDPQVCGDVLGLGVSSTSPSASVSPSTYTCPDFDLLTIVGTGWTEYDPHGVLAAAGSDVTVDCPVGGGGSNIAYLQRTSGMSQVLPWYRFKLEVRSLPSSYEGAIAYMFFYSTGESAIGLKFSCSHTFMGSTVPTYLVISGEGPFHGFHGPQYILSSNFDRWIQIRIDPGFLYADIYTNSGFTSLDNSPDFNSVPQLGYVSTANTGWTDPITVTGIAPIQTTYTTYVQGLLMSVRNFSVCEE